MVQNFRIRDDVKLEHFQAMKYAGLAIEGTVPPMGEESLPGGLYALISGQFSTLHFKDPTLLN